jgi:type I restriction enzyme S subunit
MTKPLYHYPRDWSVADLEQDPNNGVISEVRGGGTPSTTEPDYWGGPILWLTPREITNDRTFHFVSTTERTITEKGMESSAAKVLPPGTVMLTSRAPVGDVVINRAPMATNQGFLNFKCGERLLPEFLYYWFKANRPYLDVVANGSTYPELFSTDLFEFQIGLPKIEEQRRIIKILGALDDKIELNRQMNKILQSIGQAFFRHWFIDYQFPNEHGDQYKSSGGEMVYNAELETEIPAKWNLGSLGDVAENPRRGVQPDTTEQGTAYIGLEHVPRKNIALSNWETSAKVISNKYRFFKGEILFGKLRPYFHKVGVAPVDGVCSTDILVIAPKSPEWRGFVLFHVSTDEFVNYTDSASTGTRMPRGNWGDMSRYRLVIPTVDVANAFDKMITPILEKIRTNICQSKILGEIRDSFLPKLISGKIRVPVEVQ